jgi:hypothetical protein
MSLTFVPREKKIQTRAGNAMRMWMQKSDRSMIFPVFFFLRKKRCDAIFLHYRNAFAFSHRIEIFAFSPFRIAKKKLSWPCVLIDHRHFPWNPWVFPGNKAFGDLNLMPNRSSRLLVQSHKYLSNQKRVQLSNANAKTWISDANANKLISDRSMRRNGFCSISECENGFALPALLKTHYKTDSISTRYT